MNNNGCIKMLEDWDNGNFIKTVSMGGLGDGYEIAIQSLGMEMLRKLIDTKSDCNLWKDEDYFEDVKRQIDNVDDMGVSGAMWGAAKNIAFVFYRQGVSTALNNKEIKDRVIYVSQKEVKNQL